MYLNFSSSNQQTEKTAKTDDNSLIAINSHIVFELNETTNIEIDFQKM